MIEQRQQELEEKFPERKEMDLDAPWQLELSKLQRKVKWVKLHILVLWIEGHVTQAKAQGGSHEWDKHEHKDTRRRSVAPQSDWIHLCVCPLTTNTLFSLALLLASPQFTCTFSCAYGCLVRVNQPLVTCDCFLCVLSFPSLTWAEEFCENKVYHFL